MQHRGLHRCGASSYLQYNESIALQATNKSVRWKEQSRKTNLKEINSFLELRKAQSQKKTDEAQPLALNKFLKFYERSPSQQHVVRRQLIRKQKNVPKNYCYKNINILFGDTINSISKTQTRNTTTCIKQSEVISRVFNKPTRPD